MFLPRSNSVAACALVDVFAATVFLGVHNLLSYSQKQIEMIKGMESSEMEGLK